MDVFRSFTLAPMSAGDIIDRAVRLYRRHFLVLLRVVVAPSLVAYAGGITYTIGLRNFSIDRGDARMVITGLMVMAGVVLYLAGKIVFFALLGGTSRALVNYFASGTELRAREVFRTVRARWWQLIGATIMVIILVMGVLAMAYMVFAFLFIIYVTLSTWVISGLPNWLQVIAHTVFGLTVAAGLLLLFLLVYSRVIFVPQALMVEEKGVFSAIGRSITLAGRDVRRIAAILAFQIYIAWSLLLLLVIPLGWYGYLNGIDINPFGGGAPLWYNIAQQTLTQLSEILLAPIAMLSFTLLYLDVRVRKEGFDVELLANRLLAPATFVLPPLPVSVAAQPAGFTGGGSFITLGLEAVEEAKTESQEVDA